MNSLADFLPRLRSAVATCVTGSILSLAAFAAPTIDPVSTAGFQSIPVGKSLVVPVSATASGSAAVNFTVSSSNPKILVRAKSGNPSLKLHVKYAGDGTVQAFEGDLVFQLFRDMAPITTGLIAGMAQSGFYDGKTFHRVVKNFMIQGGDPAGNGSGGPGFQFENEFNPALIFTGRGQLAMANAGYDNNYDATNGSQFFVTDSNPRHLDFNHTIFGQLVRGFDVLSQVENVTVMSNGAGEISRPAVNVVIESAKVEENDHDAVLMLSATGTGSAAITVTANDGTGDATTTFNVTSAVDTVNSPPFYLPPSNLAAPIFPTVFSVPFPGHVDLEFDYPLFASGIVDSTADYAQQSDGVLVRAKQNYTGQSRLVFGLRQFNPVDGMSADFDDLVPVTLGIGDKPIATRPNTVYAQPGVASGPLTVATFTDSDLRGGAANFTAKINWGDGTAIVNGTVGRDTTRPVFTGAAVTGSHTYAKPGIYEVVVDLVGNKGFTTKVRTTAVVTADPIRAVGTVTLVRGPRAANRIVANFSDSTPGAPVDYEATIDWGDGKHSSGIVRRAGPGKFTVLGTHVFADAEPYPVSVRIHKIGTPLSQTATAWSIVKTAGFTPASGEHLPPFSQSRPVLLTHNEFTSVQLLAPNRETIGSGPTAQTVFTWDVVVFNIGNLSSKAGKVRFYLSKDRELNLTPSSMTNPADIPLTIGTSSTDVSFPALKPGTGIRFTFANAKTDGRLRAPVGEDGTGYNLLAAIEYTDPIGDLMPIDRVVSEGPFNGIKVSATALETTESAADPKHAATFTVVLTKQPTNDVTIALTNGDTSEGSLSTTSLLFTTSDWNVPHPVTVTGVDDSLFDGDQTYKITLQPAVSADLHFRDTSGGQVTVVNRDDEGKVIVSPTSIVTTEAAGTSHTASFTVKLDRAPAGNATVIVPISSSNTGEGTVDKSSLTFTSSNWSTAQTVNITAVADGVKDGDKNYTIIVSPATSGDPHFNGADGADIAVKNIDQD